MNYSNHTACRICGSENLVKYIDLGYLPLSNNLVSSPYDMPERFPLQVLRCQECGLSQLSVVVNRDLLFSHYVYRSSISKTYRDHCCEMARQLAWRYDLTHNHKMIDIAGNDGTLLKEFKTEIGLNVLNIDPAKNLVSHCEQNGIKVIPEFWSSDLAISLTNNGYAADLVTATNVFAHVDDVKDFMVGIKEILAKPTGVLVLEFPYLIDFIQHREFDTIYFEHLSYMSIGPLKKLCNSMGLSLMDVERQNIHGGSVRVHIGFGRQEKSVDEIIQMESNYEMSDFYKFGMDSWKQIYKFADQIRQLKAEGNRICAFAASAKGNTLLNTSQINFNMIDRIYDETDEKIGKYSPGCLIKIHPLQEMKFYKTDYLVILSWNFKDEIIEKTKQAGYDGKYIIPIPEFAVVSNKTADISAA